LVVFNSNLDPAAPSHPPVAEEDGAEQKPVLGKAWAFFVAIEVYLELPAAAGSANGQADLVDQARQAITQFLKPVEENGSLCM
jgi:hypothetical protein